MNTLTRPRPIEDEPEVTLTIVGEPEASPESRVPATRRRARMHALPPATGAKLAPAKAELVEQFDTGQRFLRAYIDGHFYWQPVSGATDDIRDRGVWMTGRDFHDAYWVNYGSYRRRAGSYHPVETADTASKAPGRQ